ncbi:MAG: RDD family protein [Candidatus Delongbacteria bacterium]|nr:RDD family protein [Candidatus Delongbacteria bacterium]
MAKSFKVSAQGLTKDMKANGSYDTIEMGEFGTDDLFGIFKLYKEVEQIVPKENEDICPASLYVSAEGKDFSFYLNNGEITDLDTEARLSVLEAVNMVSGVTGTAEIEEKAKSQAESRPKTVMPEITDPKALELLEVLKTKADVSDFRRRFKYVTNGPDDPEFKRVKEIILNGETDHVYKYRLKDIPPRVWAFAGAGVIRRFFSFVFDIPLYLIFFAIGLFVFFGSEPAESGGGLLALWMLISAFLYFVVLEWLLSASPGGIMTGIRISNKNGGRPSLIFCALRQIPRVFRFGLMVLGVMFAGNARTANAQMGMGASIVEVGGMGAGEVVLNKTPKNN